MSNPRDDDDAEQSGEPRFRRAAMPGATSEASASWPDMSSSDDFPTPATGPLTVGHPCAGRLRPTLALEPEEHLASYVSRLARRHGKTARPFCLDLGLGWRALLRGDPTSIDQLAGVSGVPAADLLHNAPRRLGRHAYEWRGNTFKRDPMRRHTLQVCPHCVRDDLRREARGEGAGPFGRVTWLLRSVRTCPKHNVPLATLEGSQGGDHDFARLIAPSAEHLARVGITRREIHPSELQTYVLDRLAGRSRPDAAWLDEMELGAAIDLCEVLGLVIAFGRSGNLRVLEGMAGHAAGDMGFAVARCGPDGLREALTAWDSGANLLQSGRKFSRYGVLQSFLARHPSRRPDLDEVRTIVVDHIKRTKAVGPGAEVLGQIVRERSVHSLTTASKQYGIGLEALRSLLVRSGALIEWDGRSDGGAALFDAHAYAPLLEGAASAITSGAVRRYINASPNQTRAILAAGLIRSIDAGAYPTIPSKWKYARKDLDAFLKALGAGAEDVHALTSGTVSISRAAMHAGCDTVTVVRAVLERRVPWVGRMVGAEGFEAILVRCQDLKRLRGRRRRDRWTRRGLASALHVSRNVADRLLSNAALAAQVVTSGVDGRRLTTFADASVNDFVRDYASLGRLATDWGLSRAACQQVLKAHDVRPALPRERYGADLYLRRDLPPSSTLLAHRDADLGSG